ncbi:MAG: hypothetical protein KAS52_03605, partial [Candidatus Heimdallarchaeota archaeon]|nr:hypothetical protein [Candidatus Heimdallarchaeota archaeon]
DTYPTLKYLYTIPEPSVDLMSNIQDSIEEFVTSIKDDYSRRLENEEQLYLLGMSSKERYESIKEKYRSILEKLGS